MMTPEEIAQATELVTFKVSIQRWMVPQIEYLVKSLTFADQQAEANQAHVGAIGIAAGMLVLPNTQDEAGDVLGRPLITVATVVREPKAMRTLPLHNMMLGSMARICQVKHEAMLEHYHKGLPDERIETLIEASNDAWRNGLKIHKHAAKLGVEFDHGASFEDVMRKRDERNPPKGN